MQVVAAIKKEETIDPPKDEAMRDVQRVVAEPLSVNYSPVGSSVLADGCSMCVRH